MLGPCGIQWISTSESWIITVGRPGRCPSLAWACGTRTQLRNPIRGPKQGPKFGPKLRTHLRDPIGGHPNVDPQLGPKLRDPIGDPNRDPNLEPIADPLAGPDRGGPKRGPKSGPTIGTQIAGPNRGPNRDPNCGTQLFSVFRRRRPSQNFGSHDLGPIWVPDWVPQFGSHFWLPIMWVLIWFPDQVSQYNSGQIAGTQTSELELPNLSFSRGVGRASRRRFWGSQQPPPTAKHNWKRWGASPPTFSGGFCNGRGAVTNALATNKNQWPRRVAFARAFCKHI